MRIGIDEAGRGPVLGPMVMAGVAVNQETANKLSDLGVTDSKMLSKKRREELFVEIKKLCVYEIKIVKPSVIDNAVFSEIDNLNLLEAKTSGKIIQTILLKLLKSLNVDVSNSLDNNSVSNKDGSDNIEDLLKGTDINCLLDLPTKKKDEYLRHVRKSGKIPTSVLVDAEFKADENDVVVGAASILAKVTRDKEIDKINSKYKINVGSGYPSDPNTQRFLQDNKNEIDTFDFVRKSWKTVSTLIKDGEQKGLGDF